MSLFSGDDRRECGKGEVNTGKADDLISEFDRRGGCFRLRNQVCLELVQIHVEGAIETK